jgi:hypothetical protein
MANDFIQALYFVMAGVFGLLILRGLFFRESCRSNVYDVVYAVAFIPFLLRVLQIK